MLSEHKSLDLGISIKIIHVRVKLLRPRELLKVCQLQVMELLTLSLVTVFLVSISQIWMRHSLTLVKILFLKELAKTNENQPDKDTDKVKFSFITLTIS